MFAIHLRSPRQPKEGFSLGSRDMRVVLRQCGRIEERPPLFPKARLDCLTTGVRRAGVRVTTCVRWHYTVHINARGMRTPTSLRLLTPSWQPGNLADTRKPCACSKTAKGIKVQVNEVPNPIAGSAILRGDINRRQTREHRRAHQLGEDTACMCHQPSKPDSTRLTRRHLR
jgi:hypothetical protein